MANTKLTSDQKTTRKDLMEFFTAQGVKLAHNCETTVAYKELGNTVEVAFSVMAPTEIKFRRKVGQFTALQNFDSGCTVKMAKEDFYMMLEDVLHIYL
jgi:hypothetical protein